MYDNYIFDLYGTLIDMSADEHSAKTWKKWLKWLDKHSLKHPNYIQFRKEFWDADKAARKQMLLAGEVEVPEIDIIDVYRELFQKYGNGVLEDSVLLELSFAFRQASTEYIKLFPGVIEYLDYLRRNGKKVYILSNAQASYTEPEIKMFHLEEHVDDYLMSSDYGCMKPDRRFFDVLLNKYNLDKSKTVMIGDSATSDIAGAEGVGIASIHLTGENEPKCFYMKNRR